MTVRSLRPADLEPLHALYSSLLTLLPHHPPVGLSQFAEELLAAVWPEDAFAPDGPIVVAEAAGRPVAFAHGSFLTGDARHPDLKAGAGLLRFGEDRAGETMWYFGEKFVRGLGASSMYLL